MLGDILVIIALVILALWVVGLVLSWGGLIHLLLVAGLVVIIYRLIRGKKNL